VTFRGIKRKLIKKSIFTVFFRGECDTERTNDGQNRHEVELRAEYFICLFAIVDIAKLLLIFLNLSEESREGFVI